LAIAVPNSLSLIWDHRQGKGLRVDSCCAATGRRVKARFPSGRQSPRQGIAPAGSNRRDEGGDEIVEAYDDCTIHRQMVRVAVISAIVVARIGSPALEVTPLPQPPREDFAMGDRAECDRSDYADAPGRNPSSEANSASAAERRILSSLSLWRSISARTRMTP